MWIPGRQKLGFTVYAYVVTGRRELSALYLEKVYAAILELEALILHISILIYLTKLFLYNFSNRIL